MRRFLFAVVAIGCSGRLESLPDDTGAPPSLERRSVALACADRARAMCRDLHACGGFALRTLYRHAFECERGEVERCERMASLPGVVTPVVVIDACTRALSRMSCAERHDETRVASHCDFTQAGSLALDAPCVAHAQCESGACADAFPRLGRCGRCAHKPRAGDPCSRAFDCSVAGVALDTGLVCDVAAARCVPAAPRGAACDDRPCASGLACVGSICVPPSAKAGDACGAGVAACDPAEDLSCVANDEFGACVRRTFAALGGRCDGVARTCRADAFCDPDRGVCVPARALGEACSAPDECGSAPDVGCIAGVCARTSTVCR